MKGKLVSLSEKLFRERIFIETVNDNYRILHKWNITFTVLLE